MSNGLTTRDTSNDNRRLIFDNFKQEYHETDGHVIDAVFHDSITGCFNERYLHSLFTLNTDIANNYVVFLVDINNFRLINERYGYVQSTEILKKIGEVVKHSVRPSDEVIRYLGNSFLLVMYNIDSNIMMKRVSEISAKVEELSFAIDPNLQIQACIGGCITDTLNYENISIAEFQLRKCKKLSRKAILCEITEKIDREFLIPRNYN